MFLIEIVVYMNKHINCDKMGLNLIKQEQSTGYELWQNSVLPAELNLCALKLFFGARDKHSNRWKTSCASMISVNTNNTHGKHSQAWEGNCRVQVPSSGRYFVSTHCVSRGNYVRHVGSLQTMNSQITGEWTPSPPAVINLALSWPVSFPLLMYRRIHQPTMWVVVRAHVHTVGKHLPICPFCTVCKWKCFGFCWVSLVSPACSLVC